MASAAALRGEAPTWPASYRSPRRLSTLFCCGYNGNVIIITTIMQFNALVLSLPTRNSTLRMRVWRALKETGCGVLRDGVYVLPADAPAAGVLPQMEAEIRASGGF